MGSGRAWRCPKRQQPVIAGETCFALGKIFLSRSPPKGLRPFGIPIAPKAPFQEEPETELSAFFGGKPRERYYLLAFGSTSQRGQPRAGLSRVFPRKPARIARARPDRRLCPCRPGPGQRGVRGPQAPGRRRHPGSRSSEAAIPARTHRLAIRPGRRLGVPRPGAQGWRFGLRSRGQGWPR